MTGTETHLGHLVPFVNLGGSWSDLFLCEIMHDLSKLIVSFFHSYSTSRLRPIMAAPSVFRLEARRGRP